MKFLKLAFSALSALCIASGVLCAATRHHDSKIVRKLSCEHVIEAKDVGTDGFVIDKEGNWCLGEDVIYNPAGDNPAIKIVVSNVTLDLNTKSLSQGTKMVPNIDGIQVAPGLTNIQITNGTVHDFSRSGIFAPPGPTPQMAGSTVIDISNVRALFNGLAQTPNAGVFGMGGIVLFNVEDGYIYNCELVGNAFAGLEAVDVTKFTMENCHCDDTVSSFLTDDTTIVACGAGIFANNSGSRDILIRNCTFNRTLGEGATAGLFVLNPFFGSARNTNLVIDGVEACDTQCTATVADELFAFADGIGIASTDNVSITNAIANTSRLVLNLAGILDTSAHGIAIEDCNNLRLVKCQTMGSSLIATQPSGTTGTCGGIIISANNFRIVDCQSGNHSGVNQGSVPFDMSTNGIDVIQATAGLIHNCQLTGSTNVSPTTPNASVLVASGLTIRQSFDVTVDECFASGNNQAARNPSGQSSLASGFNTSLSKRIVFKRCVASNNSDSSLGRAFGFSTTETTTPGAFSDSIIFDSCIAEANISFNGLGGGFDIRDVIGSKMLNCVADRNSVGIFVTETNPGTTGNNLFTGNVLLANVEAGIFDTTTNQSNAYFSNRAESNGPTPETTNYLGAIFPAATCDHPCFSANRTPIRLWKLPNAPCHHNTNCQDCDLLDNLSIER